MGRVALSGSGTGAVVEGEGSENESLKGSSESDEEGGRRVESEVPDREYGEDDE